MTPLQDSRIESDVIRRIAGRLGSAAPRAEEAITAVDYDWRQCHHYSPDALSQLRGVFEATCQTIAEKLTDLFHAKPEVTVGSLEQLFAHEAVEEPDPTSSWTLRLSRQKGGPCGYLSLSSATAMKWVAQLLGDEGAKNDTSRELSELEETLLQDITGAIAQAFVAAIAAAGGSAMSAEVQLTRGGQSILDPLADVCKSTLSIKTAADTSTMDLVLLCDSMDAIVGMGAKEASATPEKVRGTILESIRPCSLTVDPILGCASVSIRDMVELKTGDVLVLDKLVGEPIEVFMSGRKLCLGQLAACEGRYAIIAEEICMGPPLNTKVGTDQRK